MADQSQMHGSRPGGAAFPEAHDDFESGRGHFVSHARGMSLRDYFAAKAMQGLLAGMLADGSTFEESTPTEIATVAGRVADAMLVERARAA